MDPMERGMKNFKFILFDQRGAHIEARPWSVEVVVALLMYMGSLSL